ncbi:formamidase [Niveomyces insectorum RCEF 264]|uniref:Formamidase n=1 Tax=Niveomyces insectorum RCEF 264 TaxID=1081102 RepID=A0A167MW55_9HYPO|nr:formamidase [Niveomyces insectorum RCEF 264]
MPIKPEELTDFSRFDFDAILRGAQLTLVGAFRALQNPDLWTTQHYRQAAIAVACGLAIRVLLEIPIFAIRSTLWCLSFVVSLDAVTWDDALADGLRFLQQYVLQLPLFLMALMRHITPALDDLFMQSLQWVDTTYAQKHAREGPVDPRQRYYENLCRYAHVSRSQKAQKTTTSPVPHVAWLDSGLGRLLWRFARKGLLSLAVFALSYVPGVGRLVLPATYYGQRSLVRELLAPYFARVRFAGAQKRTWFESRAALLFGFGAGFYVLLRIPLVGVLVYGLAEASTAYLVTKITDPPPAGPDAATAAVQAAYARSQEQWHNKKAFLALALDNLDALHRRTPATTEDPDRPGGGGSEYASPAPAVAALQPPSSSLPSAPPQPAQPPPPTQKQKPKSGPAQRRPQPAATTATAYEDEPEDDPDRPRVQPRVYNSDDSDDPPPPYTAFPGR